MNNRPAFSKCNFITLVTHTWPTESLIEGTNAVINLPQSAVKPQAVQKNFSGFLLADLVETLS